MPFLAFRTEHWCGILSVFLYTIHVIYVQQITLKKLKAALPMYFAKLGNVEEAHTFCQELALKKVSTVILCSGTEVEYIS